MLTRAQHLQPLTSPYVFCAHIQDNHHCSKTANFIFFLLYTKLYTHLPACYGSHHVLDNNNHICIHRHTCTHCHLCVCHAWASSFMYCFPFVEITAMYSTQPHTSAMLFTHSFQSFILYWNRSFGVPMDRKSQCTYVHIIPFMADSRAYCAHCNSGVNHKQMH